MSHNIAPNKPHAIIAMHLAISEVDADTITDGLNEILHDHVAQGFIADYAFYNPETPMLVQSSTTPVEGELFHSTTISDLGDFSAFCDDGLAEKLVLENYDIDSVDQIHQGLIDSVDYDVAVAAQELQFDDELLSAITLLQVTHPGIAQTLIDITKQSVVRNYIQALQ